MFMILGGRAQRTRDNSHAHRENTDSSQTCSGNRYFTVSNPTLHIFYLFMSLFKAISTQQPFPGITDTTTIPRHHRPFWPKQNIRNKTRNYNPDIYLWLGHQVQLSLLHHSWPTSKRSSNYDLVRNITYFNIHPSSILCYGEAVNNPMPSSLNSCCC